MAHVTVTALLALGLVTLARPVVAEGPPTTAAPAKGESCEDCHRRLSPALVMEWEGSR
jgi:hypothetical protein